MQSLDKRYDEEVVVGNVAFRKPQTGCLDTVIGGESGPLACWSWWIFAFKYANTGSGGGVRNQSLPSSTNWTSNGYGGSGDCY